MKRMIVAAAFAACAAATVTAQDGKPTDAATEEAQTTGSVAQPAVDCDARHFETSIEFEKDGEKRQTKLKLCPIKGEPPTNWAKTLGDAKARIAANPNITQESKTRIAAELDAEIVRVQSFQTADHALPEALIPPATRAPEYGTYAPLPAPSDAARPAPALVAGKQLSAAVPPANPAVKPRLTIKCLESGERGAGSDCFTLARTMRLAIQAGEDLGSDISLRFLRKGEIRGEIALAGMRQGQLIRYNLPPKLCLGVVNSNAEIQVLSAKQVVETLGPYKLRC